MVGIGRQAKLRGRAVGVEASIQRLFHMSGPRHEEPANRCAFGGTLAAYRVADGSQSWKHPLAPCNSARPDGPGHRMHSLGIIGGG